MTKQIFGFLLSFTLVLTSCTSTLDQPISIAEFDKVKEEINSDDAYSKMEKKFLIDHLSTELKIIQMGNFMKMEGIKLPTFREKIDAYEKDFDSIRTEKLKSREDNKLLENFIVLKDAKTVGMSKYKGYLSMTLDFNNQFDKEILYILLEYKYVNKYDTQYFKEYSKLTDQVAEGFDKEVEIMTTEEYNDVADFIYTKVPVRAKQALIDELGEEAANNKVERDYLMEGLKVMATGIVFKDKTELMYKDADWQYFEEENE